MAVQITRDGNGRMNPSMDDLLHNLEEIADFAEDIEAGTAEIPIPIGSLADDSVTNDKLANIARGSVKVGGAANAPTDLDAKTSGRILVGDGTDLASVAVSGDATLASSGAITIANNAVSNAKLAAMVAGTIKIGSAAGAASDLAAGAANSVLTAHGGGAEPTWETLDIADAVTIYNETGSTITKGTLVNLSGFSGTDGITVTKADADANIPATHVVIADILTLSSGTVEALKTLSGFDTSLLAIGNPVYLSGTAGEYTAVAPTGADQLQQIVGVVKTVNAGAGEIVFFPGSHQAKKFGTSFLQDDAVSTSQIANTAVTIGKVDTSISGTLAIVGRNQSGGNYAAGTLLKISGYASGAYVMTVADAGAGEVATHVCTSEFVNNTNTYVYPFTQFGGFDTSLKTIGDLIYSDPTTPGAFTYTPPTGADQLSQVVGLVVTVDVAGSIAFFPGLDLVKKIGTDSLQDLAVTNAKVGTTAAIDFSKLATLTSGNLLVGSAGNVPTSVAMSGDATIVASGALTVGTGAITNGKLGAYAVTYDKMGQYTEAEAVSFSVRNTSGGTLNPGTLVRVNSWAAGFPTVVVADAGAGEIATHVVTQAINNNTNGVVFPVSFVTSLNTVATPAGTLLFADPTTPGGYTSTEPTAAGQISQQVGVVITQDAATGIVEFFPGRMVVKKHGTSNLQDDAVTAAKIASIDLENTTVTNIADTELLIGTGAGTAAFAAMSGDATLANNGALTIATGAVEDSMIEGLAAGQIILGVDGTAANNLKAVLSGDVTMDATGAVTIGALAVETGMIADDAVTGAKMNLVVSACLGTPIVATNDRIVTVVNLVNGAQAIAGYPDTPRNLTVTIVDTTPSITAGTVTVDGLGADGAVIQEVFNCAAGAGVYTGTKIFGNITAVTTADFSVLGGAGDETIKVGVGNVIGLPSNIAANSAIKNTYLGGTIPGVITITSGVNTSGVDVNGATYNGTKMLVVNYNVGG